MLFFCSELSTAGSYCFHWACLGRGGNWPAKLAPTTHLSFRPGIAWGDSKSKRKTWIYVRSSPSRFDSTETGSEEIDWDSSNTKFEESLSLMLVFSGAVTPQASGGLICKAGGNRKRAQSTNSLINSTVQKLGFRRSFLNSDERNKTGPVPVVSPPVLKNNYES